MAMTYYTRHIPLQVQYVTTSVAPQTVRTMDLAPYVSGMNNYEVVYRDPPPKPPPDTYKYVYKYRPRPMKYGGGKKQQWWSKWNKWNPFACKDEEYDDEDEDYDDEDEDDDDEDDDLDSIELFRRRKFKKKFKLSKKKKKKKQQLKEKKKKLLIKFLIGLAVFLVLKFLFEKFVYFFPSIFPTTARDELLHQVDMLFSEGISFERGSDWREAKTFEEENRAFFGPKFYETRIDVTIPLRSVVERAKRENLRQNKV